MGQAAPSADRAADMSGWKPERVKSDKRPTHLYRIYDTECVLLYVGITVDLNTRMNQHRKHPQKGQWFKTAGPVKTELYADRETAAIAEYRAIASEKPLHNWAPEDQYKDCTTPTPAPLHTQEYGAGRWRLP